MTIQTRIIAIVTGTIAVAVPLTAHAARCSDGRDSNTATPASSASSTDATTPPPTSEECIERDIYFMPGASGIFFQPHRAPGPFYGAGVQVAPFQWSRNNDRFGPSQGSLYFQVAMLGSQQSSRVLTMFEVGGTASFERNSSRRWLIPYFGATAGGMTQAQIGSAGYIYPLAGAHLYWHRNLMVDAEGGYHFPFEHIDQTRGPRGQLTARFSLW